MRGSGPEIYSTFGVKPFINCTSTYTINGGSAMLPEVIEAMNNASFYPVNFDELMEGAGKRIAELLQGETLRRVIDIDAEARLADLTGLEIRGLMRFEPCGQGNRKPVLLSRGVKLVNSRPVGSDKSHLKLTVKDGLGTWSGIAFRQAESELAPEVDIVYSLQRDWRGETVELEVLDVAPTGSRRGLEMGIRP